MHNNITRIIRKSARFLAIVLLAGFSLIPASTNRVYATHAAAADVYFTWIGGNSYIFRVYFYRDCSGVSEPGTVVLNAQGCSQNLGISLPKAGSSTGTEVPPICFLGTSTCNGGSVFGTKEYVYAAIYTLPVACATWTFSYSICCRNCAISNIVNPCSQSQYFFATYNSVVAPNNTLLRFNTAPFPFRCVDAPFCIDLSASDADGDSISYALSTPQTSAGGFVSWQSGYSATNPIPSSPASTFNSTTGQFCINPTFQGQYVMAVRAYEWRRFPAGTGPYVQIASVQRDMQVNMVPCPCLFPLPVEIADFKGQNLGGYNLLKWSTASEKGNDYFLLQRSDDGVSFETIGKIKGAGNSTSMVDYSWKDLVGTDRDESFYRLEQVDFDGNSTFSDIISVRNYIIKADIDVYPVPFQDKLNVSFPSKDPGNYVVTLRNNVGVLVRQWRIRKPEGPYTHTLDIDEESGFYIVDVQGENGVTTFKVFASSSAASGR